MTRQELRTCVEGVVRAALNEERKRLADRQLYEQADRIVNEHFAAIIKEDDETNNKRSYVLSILRGDKGDKYNYAELARRLWHPKDKSEEDTYRSLFSKKLSGKPDNDGAIRSFDDSEINKLYELLRQQ